MKKILTNNKIILCITLSAISLYIIISAYSNKMYSIWRSQQIFEYQLIIQDKIHNKDKSTQYAVLQLQNIVILIGKNKIDSYVSFCNENLGDTFPFLISHSKDLEGQEKIDFENGIQIIKNVCSQYNKNNQTCQIGVKQE